MQDSTTIPTIKWSQRKDRLYITIDVVGLKTPVIDVIDGKKLKFQGTDGNKKFAFQIELFDEVIKEESKYNLAARNIFLNIKKKTKGPYWPRLIKDTAKFNWIQVDWTYYVDEDEEEDDTNKPNFGEGQGKKM
jgi:cytosolic prostaglandin-E synthase